VSLRECRRVAGKPRCEHIASLGSIPVPMTITDRVGFYRRASERLKSLANRIGAEDKKKIVAALHTKIPPLTDDDIRTVQRENAEADKNFWEGLERLNEDMGKRKKDFGEAMLRVAADLKAAQEAATKEVCAARDRLDRLAKGDDVKGGLGKPIDLDEVLRKAGVTKKELRRWKQIALISDLGAGDELLNETIKSFRRAETATHRKVLKKTVIQALRDGRLR
jgi:ATP-dependent exoDNAse (exonuclease V) beta subunit